MKKPKKITIKPFINDKLGIVSIKESEAIEGVSHYSYFNNKLNFFGHPLYYMLIYDRNNTKFRSKYGGYYGSIDEVEKNSPKLLDYEVSLIEKIFNYKLKREKDNLQLKGFGLTYDNLGTDLSEYMNNSLMNVLEISCFGADKLKSALFNFKDRTNHFFVYYEAAQLLIPDLSDLISEEFSSNIMVFANYLKAIDRIKKRIPQRIPVFPVIDWITGEHKTEVEKEFKKMKVENVEQSVDIVDKMIWLYISMS